MFTDLVKNQVADTTRINKIPEDKVISDFWLMDQPSKQFVKAENIGALVVVRIFPREETIS